MVANPSSNTPVNEHNTIFISSNIINLIIYENILRKLKIIFKISSKNQENNKKLETQP